MTLHLNAEGYEFWTVRGAYGAIFAHPTLKELTLSSANIPSDATKLVRAGTTTPLRSLTFDECNITSQGLRGILNLPAGLEYLFLGKDESSPESVKALADLTMHRGKYMVRRRRLDLRARQQRLDRSRSRILHHIPQRAEGDVERIALYGEGRGKCRPSHTTLLVLDRTSRLPAPGNHTP